jgi:hypothetical protein
LVVSFVLGRVVGSEGDQSSSTAAIVFGFYEGKILDLKAVKNMWHSRNVHTGEVDFEIE